MSQKEVNVVNQNNKPFDAKVVFRRPNELHETPEFVELFGKEALLNFVEITKENCGILPVVVNSKGEVVVGNARLFVAKTINLNILPTVRQELLTSEDLEDFRFFAMQTASSFNLGARFLAAELIELQAIGLKGKFLIQNEDEEDGFTEV